MAFPFDGYEVDTPMRPDTQSCAFDLEKTLTAVVAVQARIPGDAFTAGSLGTERLGNGTVIGPGGLVLTMGYLITEAAEVTLTLNDGSRAAAHVLGIDPVTGFGLVQALEPLNLPALPLGNSKDLKPGSPVTIAGAGGWAHAATGKVVARTPFAGYWEYYLENAIITEPAHPHWSGAALIGSAGELLGAGSLSLERLSRSGPKPINMFVPIDLLPPILDDLTRGRSPYPPRPWLGIVGQEGAGTVVVAGVSPGGPAARAELRRGDVILAVAGTPVSDLATLYTSMWAQGDAGAVIRLRIDREADVFDVDIRSVDRSALLKKPKFH